MSSDSEVEVLSETVHVLDETDPGTVWLPSDDDDEQEKKQDDVETEKNEESDSDAIDGEPVGRDKNAEVVPEESNVEDSDSFCASDELSAEKAKKAEGSTK